MEIHLVAGEIYGQVPEDRTVTDGPCVLGRPADDLEAEKLFNARGLGHLRRGWLVVKYICLRVRLFFAHLSIRTGMRAGWF